MDNLNNFISQAIKQLFGEDVEVNLTRTGQQFGDFTTSVALKLAKQLGKNPREIASSIAQKLSDLPEITSAEVAGPGFINIRVTDGVLVELIKQQVNFKPQKNQKIVIETNNPNPFKAMHIGHAFNAILADTIANLLEAGGAELHRVSYHGDVGAHVGKSMYSLLEYIDGDVQKLNNIPVAERNSFMSQMYAAGAKAYKEDGKVKATIDALAAESFELKDIIYKEVYETCLKWSFEQIDELVAALGNKPVEKRYLESQANDLGEEIVKNDQNNVFIKSDGAFVFPGEKYGIFDNVFVSSKGQGLYGARDLGLIQLKYRDYQPNRSYIVTAREQQDYFRGVIKAAELCMPEFEGMTVNISTGMVKLSTGKMSSRKGDVVEVAWLFKQVTEAIVAWGQEPLTEVVVSAILARGQEPLPEVIVAVIRYQFLKVRVGSDVVFNVDEAINVQGNTGPYLQYAYARAAAILRKLTEREPADITNLQTDEHELLLKVSEYNTALSKAIEELSPHLLANYLYELTQNFNAFYERNRVIDDPRQNIRLELLRLYKDVLGKGLNLLGIPVLEKM